MLKRALLILTSSLALSSMPSHAQMQSEIIYSAPQSNSVPGWCMNREQYRFAVKLTLPVDQSYDVTSVRLPVWFEETNPATAIDVQVFKWTQDSIEPTAADLLADLTIVETLPQPQDTGVSDFERHEYNFLASQPLRFEPGSSFWVGFSSATASGACDVYTSTSTLPTGGILSRAAEYQGSFVDWNDQTFSGRVTELVVFGRQASAPPEATIACTPSELTDAVNQVSTCTVTLSTLAEQDIDINLNLPDASTRYNTSCTSPMLVAAGATSASCTITATANTVPGDGDVVAQLSVAEPSTENAYIAAGSPAQILIKDDDKPSSVGLIPVPSLGVWGMMLTSSVLALAAILRLSRRRKL